MDVGGVCIPGNETNTTTVLTRGKSPVPQSKCFRQTETYTWTACAIGSSSSTEPWSLHVMLTDIDDNIICQCSIIHRDHTYALTVGCTTEIDQTPLNVCPPVTIQWLPCGFTEMD